MNYIGSKLSLLSFLEESINQIIDSNCQVFCDFFAGTGIVGSYFKKKGYTIVANDIQYYSFVLNQHYIGNNARLTFDGLLPILPQLQRIDVDKRAEWVCHSLSLILGVQGFIYQHYCLGGTQHEACTRQYFSDANGMRCDAIRMEIENWRIKSWISESEYYFLLSSLIESIDKYANTASVYGAFLKRLKKEAQKSFVLKPAELIISTRPHQVFNMDINELASRVTGDIVYLDPPYNHRQYASNYHLLETIAKYDSPTLHGKTGLRDYRQQRSLYCSQSHATAAFRSLILSLQAKYIFLSYNNEGVMTLDDIRDIMSLRGQYGYFTKDYARFKADNHRAYSAKTTTEYLHYVIVS